MKLQISREASITAQSAIRKCPDLPRAIARAEVTVHVPDGCSRLKTLHQLGALKLLFPKGRPDVEAIAVNTAGGITGGDDFRLSATALADAGLTVTTQAAERIYRALPGQTARVETRLCAKAGARLNWLPQETILFNGCALHRRLIAELEPGAQFLLVEPFIFGRAAMGETLTHAAVRDRIEIRRGGSPIYLDATALAGDAAAMLQRRAVAGGAGAMASLVLVAPEAEVQLAPLRRMLPQTAGASLLGPDLLVLRLLARDGFALRQCLVPVLERLLPAGLPRTW
ncbi:urease accessory protein UreD, partial [Leisingera sp.]|uniref:urease accessory protein UreD n=1 Tax=Leisingera sp. TaxID=1879318 RepID=UPI002B27BAA4